MTRITVGAATSCDDPAPDQPPPRDHPGWARRGQPRHRRDRLAGQQQPGSRAGQPFSASRHRRGPGAAAGTGQPQRAAAGRADRRRRCPAGRPRHPRVGVQWWLTRADAAGAARRRARGAPDQPARRAHQPAHPRAAGLPAGQRRQPVRPGRSRRVFDYRYRIPLDHPAGTCWYHPHHHGTVADQVFGGLAGALLVDAAGRAPTCRSPPTAVLLVTDITLDTDGRVATDQRDGPDDGPRGRAGAGQRPAPTRRSPPYPARSQRWRIINGCISRILAIRLDGHQLVQVAQDGTFLPAAGSTGSSAARPGQPRRRARPPRPAPATTRWSRTPTTAGRLGMMGGRQRDRRARSPWPPWPPTGPTGHRGTATQRRCPPRHPPPARLTVQRQTHLPDGHGRHGQRGGHGASPSTAAPSTRPATTRPSRLGTTEDWTVTNTSPMDHPFHLHVWPFPCSPPAPAYRQTGYLQDVVLDPSPRLGPAAHPVHDPPRPQRLPLPHPRPRRRRHDGHRQRPRLGHHAPLRRPAPSPAT